MKLLRQPFADVQLVNRAEVGRPAGDDARPVDDATEPVVDLRRGGEEATIRRDERELVQLRDLGDAGGATELRELRPGRVAGVDLDVGRPARALEARQGGLGAAGAGEQ